LPLRQFSIDYALAVDAYARYADAACRYAAAYFATLRLRHFAILLMLPCLSCFMLLLDIFRCRLSPFTLFFRC